MTLKYGFLGFAIGGAKAGVIIAQNASKEERHARMFAFGKMIAPIIRKGIYIPATDMNCSIDDIKMLYKGAKMKARFRPFKDISYLYTAWTVVESALVATGKQESLCAAIEGAGKVGMECASILAGKGIKICALSTVKGAIFDSKGLDMKSIVALRKKYGDDFVKHAKAKKVPLSKLATLDVDIFIPAAHAYSINKSNRSKVKARVISCAANSPMDNETYEYLHKKSVIVIPDAVANSGGVLGSFMERSTKKEVIKSLVENEFSVILTKLIDKSKKEKKSLRSITEKIIYDRFQRTKQKEEAKMMNRIGTYTGMQATRLGHKLRQEHYRKDIFGDLLNNI